MIFSAKLRFIPLCGHFFLPHVKVLLKTYMVIELLLLSISEHTQLCFFFSVTLLKYVLLLPFVGGKDLT